MATISGRRRNADEDGRSAGGKIIRSRRTPASARTPYDRPKPLTAIKDPVPSSGNPKWLSGLVYSARVIASGACKIFSTVLGPDSSSSSSSSGGDSDSEYEDGVSPAGDDELNKVLSSSNVKGENMRLIQQLVVQEAFSREECDELINLIQSRVVKGVESIRDTEKTQDVRTTAVMATREWLKEKNSGSGSKLKMEDQMCETNQGVLLSLVSESKTGSPVNMAKSYMEARPVWSPSLKHVEFRTPSPIQNSKEEISKSIFHSPLQLSETKKTPLSAGSWNILEEIRKVRSKATEELLATTTPKKIDLPSSSLENKIRQEPLTNNMNEEEPGEKLHNMTSITSNANSNASLELVATNCRGLPESAEMERDGLQNEALQTNNVLKQLQDEETIQATENTGCQQLNEMNGSRDYSAATGHALSLSAADQTPDPCDKEMIDVVDSRKDRVDRNTPNEKLEHQTEPSNVVLANENNSIWTGSQNSSSMQQEDLLQDVTQSNPKLRVNVAPTGRRARGYSRRGRGRGK